MKFEVKRGGIRIVPENEQDKAYIEDTIGLKREGYAVLLRRVAPYGLSSTLAYLTTENDHYQPSEPIEPASPGTEVGRDEETDGQQQ